VGVEWESTGVVDLTCKFQYFRNSGIGGQVILESRVSNSHS
jgi:hypothetical protein